MKLLRWAVAGASVYAVYRYSIGQKAKGEDVFVSKDREIARLSEETKGKAASEPSKKGGARKKS